MHGTDFPTVPRLDDDRCWDALLRRDAAFEGRVYVGVLSTGIYCRFTCPARRPLRKNVRFFASTTAAEGAGLRACLRCRPRAADAADANAERVHAACRFIDGNDGDDAETTSLAALAERAGLSPSHFARSFKAIVGVTPKQYVDAARLARLKRALKTAPDVTAAVLDAGYASSTGVYGRADARLGMTPQQYRRGGEGMTISYGTAQTPLGLLMAGATDRGLCFVHFGETREALLRALHAEYPRAKLEAMREPPDPAFAAWIAALNRHLAGTQPRLDLPIDLRGSAFQLRVWNYLTSIPYGEVRSYADVAEGIGAPGASRAVARACASNPLAVVVPCHRVIRGDGALAGYRWGLERKRALLALPRARKSPAGGAGPSRIGKRTG
jgi:AraC family transcriptional regulator of adaptative response/methylated-DNA-[protein]-cysteine methyltransferase